VTSGGETAHHHDIPRRLIRRNPYRNQADRLMEAAVSLSSNLQIPYAIHIFFLILKFKLDHGNEGYFATCFLLRLESPTSSQFLLDQASSSRNQELLS